MNKSRELKKLIISKQLEFIMEAHNGLSAKIVEEAGFKGLWASGLSISAALGVRDNNEASWTQVLEVLEFMSDATTIPILLDGDTGYGNFNNMRRLVRKLEQRGVAGVCIEDKLFPKTNSFIDGEAQPLADIDEFCGKIRAAKEAQTEPDFVVVARVEAFIAGWGLDEAVRRAEAYRQAGADAILMHSKKSNASDIEAFMEVWGDRHPVVIVPTKYYSTPTEQFKEWGISTVIWANHNVRAAITAMEQVTKQIYEDQHLRNVEDKIATVSHIFELQGAAELKEAEKRYLPSYGQSMNAIILAASRGSKLGELTEHKPKAMLTVQGKTILEHQVQQLNTLGIKDITVVRGYQKEAIQLPSLSYIDNDEYATTGILYSLVQALDEIKGMTVMTYGDIIFKSYILNELLNDEHDITLMVDAHIQLEDETRDLVSASQAYNRRNFNQVVTLEKIDEKLSDAHGEFIGMWKVTPRGAEQLKEQLHEYKQEHDIRTATLQHFLTYVTQTYPIHIKYIEGSWFDIDSVKDLQGAEEA